MTLNEFIERLQEEVKKGYGEYEIRYVDFSGYFANGIEVSVEDKKITIE